MTLTPHPMTKAYTMLKIVIFLSTFYGVLGLGAGLLLMCGGLFLFAPSVQGVLQTGGALIAGVAVMFSALFSFGFAQLIELVFEIRGVV